MANILDNTTSLQNLLNKANDLPNAGSDITLPELSNPASAYEIFLGKEAIDESGEKVIGSFTIDSEINTQENLVSQIITALEGKSGGTGGNTDAEDSLIEGNLITYENSRITFLRSYAFYYCKSLTAVSFPSCTNIGSSAFYYCSSLTAVSFPACKIIGSNAFDTCKYLKSANFPNCKSIGGYAFRMCSSLTTISFPACTNIGSSAFYSCSKLTTVDFPNCTSMGNHAFYACSKLTSANLPVCNDIWSSTFKNCYNLSSLTLGASTVCTLYNSNAFSSTPYAGYKSSFSGTPYIYVPSSLLASYKTATNWAYFSSYFSAIGGQGDHSGGSDD